MVTEVRELILHLLTLVVITTNVYIDDYQEWLHICPTP
jgi:hypothetical protein